MARSEEKGHTVALLAPKLLRPLPETAIGPFTEDVKLTVVVEKRLSGQPPTTSQGMAAAKASRSMPKMAPRGVHGMPLTMPAMGRMAAPSWRAGSPP